MLYLCIKRACAGALAGLLWAGASVVTVSANAYAQETRVAAVNSDRILRESVPAQKAKNTLEQQFSTRANELKTMEQQLKKLSDAYTKKSEKLAGSALLDEQQELSHFDEEFRHKQREFYKDLDRRRNQEIARVLEQANKAIARVAEQEHYDLVLQEAVYVNPRIDITDKVIKLLSNSAR